MEKEQSFEKMDRSTGIKPMKPTPLNTSLALKSDGFTNLLDALDYASQGKSGFNFYDQRGEVETVLTYRDLRAEARLLAARLLSLGGKKGDRVGIIAETKPMFHRFFFACLYAGLIPVALPALVQLGARKAYVGQIKRMLESSGATIAVANASHASFLQEATEDLDLLMSGTPEEFDALTADKVEFTAPAATDIAYLQYTSGSTSFPRGVEINHATALANIQEIAKHGLYLTNEDRFVSWLPFYHDMGLIGFVLVPLIAQSSVDYLSTQTFAMRPRLWLKLISDNRGTISSSPTFGYALCARRLRPSDYERYDLSSWRTACVGAEQINPVPLKAFADALAPCGFDSKAFVACYGMAECVLAVSFAPLDLGLSIDYVDQNIMTTSGQAVPVDPQSDAAATYADCGALLPGFEFSIRDNHNKEVGQRHCGEIFLRGPSVMTGYFKDEVATRAVLDDVRLGGVAAFSVAGLEDEEVAVMIVETRLKNTEKRAELVQRISELILTHFGVRVVIDLVRPGSLPRTTSGKLSRFRSREDYFERQQVVSASHLGKTAKLR